MLTNGIQEALYNVSASLNPLALKDYPHELRSDTPFFDSSVDYWKSRGFIPQKIPDFIASPFALRLALLFHVSTNTKSYLNIAYPTDQTPLSHYYALLPAPAHPDTLIAVTLRSEYDNTLTLCAVSNRNKRNTGCLRVRISELGEFHNPELFLIYSPEVLIPDVSNLEAIWNSLGDFVRAADTKSEILIKPTERALRFTNYLSNSLESIFFTTHHN